MQASCYKLRTLTLLIALLSQLMSPTFASAQLAEKGSSPATATEQNKTNAAQEAVSAEAEELNKKVIELYAQGRFDEALPMAKRLLLMLEQSVGPEHPEVASALNILGLLYREKQDFAHAEPLFIRALAINEKAHGPEHSGLATTLSNLAGLYQERGDYDQAEPLLQRAMAIDEKVLDSNDPGLATDLNNLAELYRAKGDYARAEPMYQRALAIYEKALGPDHPDVASPLGNLAALYNEKSDYARAEPLFRRALAINEKALGPEHPDTALALNNLGLIYEEMGHYDLAEKYLLRALVIREKVFGRDGPNTGDTLTNLGGLYYTKGDYVRAEQYFRRALSVDEKLYGADSIKVETELNNLAELYRTKGDQESARPLYRRALSILEKALGPEHPVIATILNNLAMSYLAEDDYASAEPLLNRSVVITEKVIGPDNPDLAGKLNNLAIMYEMKGDDASAERLYQRILLMLEKALGPDHPQVAASLNNLAGLYYTAGDYDRAGPLFERSLAISEKTFGPLHPLVHTALSNLSVVYWARGKLSEALRFNTREVAIRDYNLRLTLTAGSEEQKRLYAATLVGETYSLVTFSLIAMPGSPEAARLALTAILERKGRTLDAVSGQFDALRNRLDGQDRALLDELLAARARLAEYAVGGPSGTDPAKYRDQLSRLEAQASELEARASLRSVEVRAELQSISLESVQRALPEGSALVELISYRPFSVKETKNGEHYGPERYAAYVLRKTGDPSCVDLGTAATIDGEITRLRAALRHPTRSDTRQLARKLDQTVMQPVRKLLGEARVIFISPDGGLNLIPFAALSDEHGRYLVESYSFIYLTSGRDLLRFQNTARDRRPPVVLAAPLFDAMPARDDKQAPPPAVPTAGRRIGELTGRFEPINGTAEEGKEVGKILSVTPRLDGRATEASLKQVQGPGILHVATHGFFLPAQKLGETDPFPLTDQTASRGPATQPDNPLLRSGLALAGANRREGGGDEDGILTALEAAGLNLRGTQLVVLSACETGLGDVLNGEGVYGLRRAFVLAGADSQLMSLWRVNDEVTRDIMVRYYRRLLNGAGRGEALRQVQLEMLRGDRSHPYFWAGFIPSGDWKNLEGR